MLSVGSFITEIPTHLHVSPQRSDPEKSFGFSTNINTNSWSMPTKFEVKQLRLNRDIVKKQENRVYLIAKKERQTLCLTGLLYTRIISNKFSSCVMARPTRELAPGAVYPMLQYLVLLNTLSSGWFKSS